MAEYVSIEVKGIREVNAKLYAYSQQLGDRVVLASLMAGARIVLKKARLLAPKSASPKTIKNVGVRPSGTLRKGIVLRKSRIYSARRGGSKIGVYITLREGKRHGLRDAYYGRWVEHGFEAKGKSRTKANTPYRTTRTNRVLFSRSQTRGRKTYPSGNMIQGRYFMRNAFSQDKLNAVRMIVDAATAGADILASRTGLK